MLPETIFDTQPTLDSATSPEPSLRDILTEYYGKYFDKELAKGYAEEYIFRVTRLCEIGD